MTIFDKSLTNDQIMMRDVCRRFVDDVIQPFISQNWQKEWDLTPEGRLPDNILIESEAIGIRTLGVPERFGGISLEPENEVRTFAVISEEIARGDSGLADKLVQNWKVSVLLRELASEEHQERWFGKLIEDPNFLFAHALTEPKGASDRWLGYNAPSAAMDTKAKKVDGGWVINGRKHYISNGYDAGLYIVYANTKPGTGMLEGTSSFILPRGAEGFKITRCNETVGCRYMNNGELEFIDCFVPDENLLCEGTALSKAGVYFRPGKIIQSAKNLGVGQSALEKTAQFVQNYSRGGRLLIKHQIVASRLADMATKVSAVSFFADYWNGKGTWLNLPEIQKERFSIILKPNYFEWDAVFSEETSLKAWKKILPINTTLIGATNTVRTIRELNDLFRLNCPNWDFKNYSGGHMAPITNPELVNPLIIDSLM